MGRIQKLSVILPVRDEPDAVKICVPVMAAMIRVPHEILVVYDSETDTTIPAIDELSGIYRSLRGVLNKRGLGVSNAIATGVDAAEGDYVFIMAVDELVPIASANQMIDLVDDQGCDFVSATRYARGGRRYGGSRVGHLLSYMGNLLFRAITRSLLTDSTTGMKIIKKSFFDTITLEAKTGWACAFELSIKGQLACLKLGEVPVISVDRLFGGESTFQLGPWLVEYLRWFWWGLRHLNRQTRVSRSIVRTER